MGLWPSVINQMAVSLGERCSGFSGMFVTFHECLMMPWSLSLSTTRPRVLSSYLWLSSTCLCVSARVADLSVHLTHYAQNIMCPLPPCHSVAIPHEGEESYQNMWQKSRNIWKYIHHHYRDDYDWFLLGGDDMFITAENLRKYLLSKELRDVSSHMLPCPAGLTRSAQLHRPIA